MDYSLNHLIQYVKANWKHVLAGIVTAYVAQHFGASGVGKIGSLLKIVGL